MLHAFLPFMVDSMLISNLIPTVMRIQRLFALVVLLLLAAARASKWIWVDGSSTFNEATTSLSPGARTQASTWTDSNANVYMFGGFGRNSVNGYDTYLSDWWLWNSTTLTWKHVAGRLDDTGPSGAPESGTVYASNQGYYPSARCCSQTWISDSGILYLYGGYGKSVFNGNTGALADVWKYDPVMDTFTYVMGSLRRDDETSGSLQSRYHGITWTVEDTVYIYGGKRDNDEPLSDLWSYTISTDSIIQLEAAINMEEPPAIHPGSRSGSGTFVYDGGLYLFGGFYCDDVRNSARCDGFGASNDLWKWDISTEEWTSIDPGGSGEYSYEYASANRPHRVAHMAMVHDPIYDLVYIFGGTYYDSGYEIPTDLMMVYNISSGWWKMLDGDIPDSLKDTEPEHVSLRSVNDSGVVGERMNHAYAYAGGYLWMFGGYTYEDLNDKDPISDLWVRDISCPLSLVTIDSTPALSCCYPGYETDTCTLCSPGTWSLGGGDTCTTCSSGLYVDYYGAGSASECVECDPGYAALGEYGACMACEAGFYSDISGSLDCDVCAAGAWSGVAAPTCINCLAGTATDSATTPCEDCSLGKYSSSNNAITCEDCPSGTYTVSLGSKSCTGCSPGFFTDSPSLACQNCEAGLFSSGFNSSFCEPCSSGSYSESTAETCTSCEAGSYTPDPTVACTECPAGRFSNSSSASSCYPCPSGYVSDSGATECTPCSAGEHSSADQSVCEACESGKISSTGEETCTNCLAGTYANSTHCLDCPSGRFSADMEDSCTGCAAGESLSPEKDSCVTCAPGKYTDMEDQLECTDCPAGEYGASTTSCLPCEAGRYSEEDGETECTGCLAGFALNSTGGVSQDNCTACATGTESNAGAAVCTPCAAGKYSDTTLGCTPCSLGTYSVEAGSQNCTLCAAGKWSNTYAAASATVCDNCFAGKWSNLTGQDNYADCFDCGIGLYSPDLGASTLETCQECAAGTWSTAGGASSGSACIPCALGKHSSEPASETCEPCEKGTHASMEGQAECTECTVGWYNIKQSATECLTCPVGRFQSATGKTICDLCDPGSFAEFVNSSSCEPCTLGSYASTSGASQCTECAVGKIGIGGLGVLEEDSCLDCEAGLYSPYTGNAQCIPCDPGKYSNTSAADCEYCESGSYCYNYGCSECTLCPQYATTALVSSDSTTVVPSLSVSDCICQTGYYGTPFHSNPCTPCPPIEGVHCPLNSTYPSALDGYWLSPTIPTSVVACNPRSACLSKNGVSTCAPGYVGQYCSECESFKYYRFDGECAPCPESSFNYIALAFIMLFLFCLALLKVSTPFSRKFHSLGITATWLQILALYSSLPAQWPEEVLSVYHFASFTNFNIELFPTECSYPLPYWTIWYLKMSAPLLFLATLFVIFCFHVLYDKLFPRGLALFTVRASEIREALGYISPRIWGSKTPTRNYSLDECSRTRYGYAALTVFTMCYTLLCSTVLDAMNCTESPDGIYRMLNNVSQECWTPQYYSEVFPIVLAFAVLYIVGIPVYVWYVFKFTPNTLSIEFLRQYGSLCIPYKAAYEWFELVNFARKLLIVIMINFVFVEVFYVQTFVSLGVLFVFLMIQFYMQPYNKPCNNTTSFTWIVVSIFHLIAALIFTTNISTSESVFFSTIVIAMFTGALAVSFWGLMLERRYSKQLQGALLSTANTGVGRRVQNFRYLERTFPDSHQHIRDFILSLDVKIQNKFFSDMDSLENVHILETNAHLEDNPVRGDSPRHSLASKARVRLSQIARESDMTVSSVIRRISSVVRGTPREPAISEPDDQGLYAGMQEYIRRRSGRGDGDVESGDLSPTRIRTSMLADEQQDHDQEFKQIDDSVSSVSND